MSLYQRFKHLFLLRLRSSRFGYAQQLAGQELLGDLICEDNIEQASDTETKAKAIRPIHVFLQAPLVVVTEASAAKPSALAYGNLQLDNRNNQLKSKEQLCERIVRSVSGGGDPPLSEVLLYKVPEVREKVKRFRAEYGNTKLGDINVNQLYGGMRDMMGIIWEPSVLDPDEGIRFRGLTVHDVIEQLPKADDSYQPLPEGMFWLLVTGDVPTKNQVKSLSNEWAERAFLPKYIIELLSGLPKTMHPMTQLSIAVTALSHDSKFRKAYNNGAASKTVLWQYVYEDSMDLMAKLPIIAARIYNNAYRNGQQPTTDWDCDADWTLNFARFLGYDEQPEFVELLRLYLTIHSDHEGGNVSAHATHLVGSALSDPYLSCAAGLNGLAGPLHGLANQQVLSWLLELQAKLGNEPSDKQIVDYVEKMLKDGKIIPGYGHAVLRRTDPRFMAQREFALKYIPNDILFKLVSQLFNVVPPLLKKLGKVSNPYPNVDAHSGVLLQHYGMKEMQFYTVLFGVSRAMGVLAQLIWSRALCLPIERPKSISTDVLSTMLKDLERHKKVLRI